MSWAGVILGIALAAIEPLTDDQRVRLATAFDGRDHQEAAFVALVENTRLWTPGVGDSPIRLQPDLTAMLGDPESYRGSLCQIAGRVQQQTPLSALYEGVTEWFVRDESGRPILVYVVGHEGDPTIGDGQAVVLHARFYKRVDDIARDGVSRSYPAFVGAWPSRPVAADAALSGVLVVVIPVSVLLVIFLLLMLYVRRNRAERRLGRPGIGERPDMDESPALPDDPVDALNEMRRRAGAGNA